MNLEELKLILETIERVGGHAWWAFIAYLLSEVIQVALVMGAFYAFILGLTRWVGRATRLLHLYQAVDPTFTFAEGISIFFPFNFTFKSKKRQIKFEFALALLLQSLIYWPRLTTLSI